MYSLPNGYLATTGQTILASQHNPPLEDLAAAMTNSMPRNGAAGMQAHLQMGGFKVINAGEPSDATDLATKGYIDAAIEAIVARLTPTGTVAAFDATVAPAGWVKRSGGTIGNALSGATARANSDTEALFTHLWTNFDNTKLPIQTSGGAASTRGASAAADFAANKRMPLFDSRTRFLRGADDGLGFDATLTVGATQVDALKTHTHTATMASAGNHVHAIERGGNGGGSAAQNGPSSGTGTFNTESAGAHTHTITVQETGEALETRPRSSVVLICIKL